MPTALLRRILACALAVAWTALLVEGAAHGLEVQHTVCDEHGVVEHLGPADSDHDVAHLSAAPAPVGDGHDVCGELLATVEEPTAPTPPTWELPDPAFAAGPAPAPQAPSVDALGPRGPPLLAYAAKTSPPRA